MIDRSKFLEAIALDPALAEAYANREWLKVFDQIWIEDNSPIANQARLPTLIQTDLLSLGGFPALRILDNIQLTYDMSRGLRDSAGQLGRPTRIALVESVASNAFGNTAFVGYTTPGGRESRIDYATIVARDPLVSSTLMIEVNASISQTPLAGLAGFMNTVQIGLQATITSTEKMCPLFNSTYLVTGDIFGGGTTQYLGPVGVGNYNAVLTIFGIEVDAGYGFAGFP